MNDIRRSILWAIFAFSMILLWDRWQVHNGRPATFFPKQTTQTETAQVATNPSRAGIPEDASIPTASSTTASPITAAALPEETAETALPRERFTLETDVLRLTFDSEGGSLVQGELRHYPDTEDKNQPFVLLDDSPSRVYVAQTGLIGPRGTTLPTHKTAMIVVDGPRQLREGDNEISIRFESPPTSGIQLIKTWTLKRGSYEIAVRHDLINTSEDPISSQLYLQLVRDGNKLPGGSTFYSTFTGPALYTEAKKYHKVDFKDIENGKADIDRLADNGYIAMVQHYFASAWLLEGGLPRENFVRKVSNNLYAIGTIVPLGEIAPGQSKTLDTRLFAGPQIETLLETLSPGLELVKDYGWLTILSKPLYWLLDKLHQIIGNWGWAIVALVLLLKIAFYWLNAKAYSSMAKMKAINPRIMEMRERLKGNPQQMQQEMMRIYREEKVNPMGGCLPIMVQIPVFIALYWVLLSSVEMRGAPWIGWIGDLSSPDPFFILPLLMTASSLLQTALNPAPPDPMQAKMMWFMPLIFSVMFFFFPAGLVLYWLTNNLLSIAQQWIINKRMGVPPQFNLPKFR